MCAHLNLRASKLAVRLGVHRSYLSNLKKGSRCSLPVLTLIEKLEAECFGPPPEEPVFVEVPIPPRPVILPTKQGIGWFKSFPAGQVPGLEGGMPELAMQNGAKNRDAVAAEVRAGMRVPEALKEGLTRGVVPLAVGEAELPREWQPAFLPLWRQYDVATRTLAQLCEVAGAGGCLTTDVADERAFAMRVEGDEMAPQIYGGDFIVMSPKEPIRIGGVALAQLREQDGGGVLLRQVSLTERGRALGKGAEGVEVRLEDCVWVVAVCSVVRRM